MLWYGTMGQKRLEETSPWLGI